MKDEEGNKHFSDKEKCTLMVKSWRDIFKITKDDENNFDADH